MEKHPTLVVDTPKQEITKMLKKGAKDWQKVCPDQRDLCEQAFDTIRKKCNRRRILLKPAFKDYDQ